MFLFLCSDDSIKHKLNHTQNGYQLLFDTKRSKLNWLQWHHVQFIHCHRLFCQHLKHFLRWSFRMNGECIKNLAKILTTQCHNFSFYFKIQIRSNIKSKSLCERNYIWLRCQLIDDNKWIYQLDRAILGKARWNVIDGLAECWTSLSHFVAVERRYVLAEYHRINFKKYQSSAMVSMFFENLSSRFAQFNLTQSRFAVKMNNFGKYFENLEMCWTNFI